MKRSELVPRSLQGPLDNYLPDPLVPSIIFIAMQCSSPPPPPMLVDRPQEVKGPDGSIELALMIRHLAIPMRAQYRASSRGLGDGKVELRLPNLVSNASVHNHLHNKLVGDRK